MRRLHQQQISFFFFTSIAFVQTKYHFSKKKLIAVKTLAKKQEKKTKTFILSQKRTFHEKQHPIKFCFRFDYTIQHKIIIVHIKKQK